MLKFCFSNLTDLYDAFQTFNSEVTHLDREIQRIESIGTTYPAQTAIADKEKKIWSNARKRSMDSFAKIERQVRQIYVTFKVNPEAGRVKLDQERRELVEQTVEPLETLIALTQRIKTDDESPDGVVKKIIYKIKQLFNRPV